VARLREVTKKRNSATMHRLISSSKKNQLDKRSNQFEKDIPLNEYEHVIIDEASMVTTELLYDFLQAYPKIKRLTLVGDVNQLPPIGWGSMMQQIMKSETIPTYRLTTNYRVYTMSGERDGVIMNANAIISHDPVYPFDFVPTTNFSLHEGPIERVFDILKGCFASSIKAEQIVIITPFNRYLEVLNKTFQSIYNVGARSVTDSRGVKWMIGDRVMLTQNDEDIGVFNGESGLITDITSKAVLVDFKQSGCHEFLLEPTQERANAQQGYAQKYNFRGTMPDEIRDGDEGDYDDERTVKNLAHSYALTVDKSQGSEWDFVILYVPEFSGGSFLNRNRIYTAITRTKRCCWVVVSDISLLNIAAVKLPAYRCENLARRLKDALPNLKPFRVPPPVQELEMTNDIRGTPEMPPGMEDQIDWDDYQ
jgi:exodeoxyribonuclease V alpha subunit